MRLVRENAIAQQAFQRYLKQIEALAIGRSNPMGNIVSKIFVTSSRNIAVGSKLKANEPTCLRVRERTQEDWRVEILDCRIVGLWDGRIVVRDRLSTINCQLKKF